MAGRARPRCDRRQRALPIVLPSTARPIRAGLAVATLLALLLAPLAAAQPDERALHLLQGLHGADPWAGETIETLEMVMVMVYVERGDVEARTRIVVDYVGRRALIEADLGDGLSTTTRVADGSVSMTVGDEEIPLPPGMAALFDTLFEPPASTFDPLDLDASYDGVRAYGGLVEGEQLTIRGESLLPGFGDVVPGTEGITDAAYVFDGEGRLLALVYELAGETMLTMYDEPLTPGVAAWPASTTYRLGPDGAERIMRMHFELVRVNEPIPEGTF